MKIALAALLIGAILMPITADEMNMVKLHVDSFTVVGVEERTVNTREMSADGVIPKIWARFRNEALLNAIPKRLDSHIIAVYSDYESDKDGPYKYLLGAKVSSAKDIPPGMVSRTVAAGTYAMFTQQGGPPPQMIVGLWKHIWSLEKPGQFQRAYKTDFEVYHDGIAANPPNTHVAIYIGLQK